MKIALYEVGTEKHVIDLDCDLPPLGTEIYITMYDGTKQVFRRKYIVQQHVLSCELYRSINLYDTNNMRSQYQVYVKEVII